MKFFGGGHVVVIGLVFGGLGNAAQAHGLAQEMTRLVERFAKIPEPLVEADEIEKIAMLARGGVGLMFNCT